MRWDKKKEVYYAEGATRKVVKFAFLPVLTYYDKYVWLERYVVTQVYRISMYYGRYWSDYRLDTLEK